MSCFNARHPRNRRVTSGGSRFAAYEGLWLVIAALILLVSLPIALSALAFKTILPEYSWEDLSALAEWVRHTAKVFPLGGLIGVTGAGSACFGLWRHTISAEHQRHRRPAWGLVIAVAAGTCVLFTVAALRREPICASVRALSSFSLPEEQIPGKIQQLQQVPRTNHNRIAREVALLLLQCRASRFTSLDDIDKKVKRASDLLERIRVASGSKTLPGWAYLAQQCLGVVRGMSVRRKLELHSALAPAETIDGPTGLASLKGVAADATADRGLRSLAWYEIACYLDIEAVYDRSHNHAAGTDEMSALAQREHEERHALEMASSLGQDFRAPQMLAYLDARQGRLDQASRDMQNAIRALRFEQRNGRLSENGTILSANRCDLLRKRAANTTGKQRAHLLERAVRAGEETIATYPDYIYGYWSLALASVAAGDRSAALYTLRLCHERQDYLGTARINDLGFFPHTARFTALLVLAVLVDTPGQRTNWPSGFDWAAAAFSHMDTCAVEMRQAIDAYNGLGQFVEIPESRAEEFAARCQQMQNHPETAQPADRQTHLPVVASAASTSRLGKDSDGSSPQRPTSPWRRRSKTARNRTSSAGSTTIKGTRRTGKSGGEPIKAAHKGSRKPTRPKNAVRRQGRE